MKFDAGNISRAQYSQLVDEQILKMKNMKVGVFNFLKIFRRLIDLICNYYKLTSDLAYSTKVQVEVADQLTTIIQAQQLQMADMRDRLEKLEGKK